MSNEKRERDQMAENSRVLATGKPRKGRRTLIASCRARKDGKQRGVKHRKEHSEGTDGAETGHCMTVERRNVGHWHRGKEAKKTSPGKNQAKRNRTANQHR